MMYTILIILGILSGFQSSSDFGKISGKVQDSEGGSGISGVTVILLENGDPKFSIRSNKSGNFSFINLPPGTYQMTARKPGFVPLEKNIVVNKNFTLRLVIPLDSESTPKQVVKREVRNPIVESPVQKPAIASPTKEVVGATEPIVNTPLASQAEPSNSIIDEVLVANEISTEEAPEPEFSEFVDVLPEPVGGLKSLYSNIVYPEAAIARRLSGTVVIRVTVDADGEPVGADILSSPHPILADAAISTIYKSRFKPGILNGKAIGSRTSIPVRFQLK